MAGGRDELLSTTGGSFVTLLLLSHASASPSPSSCHRVSPPTLALRSGCDICQLAGWHRGGDTSTGILGLPGLPWVSTGSRSHHAW